MSTTRAAGEVGRGRQQGWLPSLAGALAADALEYRPRSWCLPLQPANLHPRCCTPLLTGTGWLPHPPPCASSGLRVATHWSPQPDMLLTTARLYDADGKLLEVSTSTAIRHEEA